MTGPLATPAPEEAAHQRALWRAVMVPAEHGGWGLTLEPVLLGLLVAPSWGGAAVGLAAFGAFLARTPAKLVAVDRRRDRWLPRTRLALLAAALEGVLVIALAAFATDAAGWSWWVPTLVAAPLVAIEAAYDIRSRGRRLVSELCGAVGIASVCAAIVLAGGHRAAIAYGSWLVLAARSAGAIPFVRAQIVKARRGITATRGSDLAQVASLAIAASAVALSRSLLAGALAVALIAAVQARWSRMQPPAVKVIGFRQLAIGLALVAVTALGIAIA